MNPYLAFAKGALALIGGVRAAIYLTLALCFLATSQFYKTEAVRLKQQRDKAVVEQMLADARTEAAKAAAESAQREALARVAATYEKDKADAIRKERAVADAVRAGALRLRRQWTCPPRSDAQAPAAAAGVDDDADLRAAAAGRIIRIGAEADAQVKALQDALSAERGKSPPH